MTRLQFFPLLGFEPKLQAKGCACSSPEAVLETWNLRPLHKCGWQTGFNMPQSIVCTWIDVPFLGGIFLGSIDSINGQNFLSRSSPQMQWLSCNPRPRDGWWVRGGTGANYYYLLVESREGGLNSGGGRMCQLHYLHFCTMKKFPKATFFCIFFAYFAVLIFWGQFCRQIALLPVTWKLHAHFWPISH